LWLSRAARADTMVGGADQHGLLLSAGVGF
jgi:hypothetical protein